MKNEKIYMSNMIMGNCTYTRRKIGGKSTKCIFKTNPYSGVLLQKLKIEK